MMKCDANGAQISFELMEKTLKCGLCKHLLNVTPIVFNSSLGYAICGRCQREKNPNTKYIFSQPLYEELVSHLTYPCSYRKDGCVQILEFPEVQTHERVCRFQTVSCPLSCTELVQHPSCGWTGSARVIDYHIQEHSDLFLDPPQFEWPEIGRNKVFFTKIGEKIVTVAVKYKRESEFLCFASINDTDLESQCYKYQLELISEDKLSSILLRRDRLQCIMNMKHDLNTPENTLQVNIQKLSEMLHSSKKIFARMGIVKKNKKNIQQITGDVISGPRSCAKAPEVDTLDEDFLSELECPVCNEFMIAPIFICPTGHSLCNVCKPKVQTCPTCKSDFTKGRNFTLEKLAAKIKYPCTNRNIGCKFVTTSNLIRSHENVCKHSKSECFYLCNWKGPLPDLANHLKLKHKGNQIINNKAFKFCISNTVTNPFSFVDIGNHLFVVVLTRASTFRAVRGNVLLNIYHVSQTDSDYVFQYNIQFSLNNYQSCPCLQLSNFCDNWTPELAQNCKEKCVIVPSNLLGNYLNQSNQGYMKINISLVT